MNVRFLTNDDDSFAGAVRDCFRNADEAWLFVAYARYQAFRRFSDSINTFLQRGGRLRSLFDLEQLATDPELLEELASIPGDSQCRGFLKLEDPEQQRQNDFALFHAKMYVFRGRRGWKAVVGSSNLTVGGISRNYEANLMISGRSGSAIYNAVWGYTSDLWNSRHVLPIDDDRLIESYRRAVDSQRRSQRRMQRGSSVERFRKRWEEAYSERTHRIPNADLAYLWGLLCGDGYADLGSREVSVNYRRGDLNRGTKHAGHIHFEGISMLNLAQEDALDGDVQTVVSSLNNLFNRARSGDEARWDRVGRWSRRIVIRFGAASPFLKEIRRYCGQTGIDDRGRITPYIPDSIMNAQDDGVKMAFLRGYYDMKCRVAVTDRLPSGPLRVALSVRGVSAAFGEQLIHLINDVVPDAHPNFLSGAPRGRETLIRLDAREFPRNLLSVPWKKQAIGDFATFNEENY